MFFFFQRVFYQVQCTEHIKYTVHRTHGNNQNKSNRRLHYCEFAFALPPPPDRCRSACMFPDRRELIKTMCKGYHNDISNHAMSV